MTVEGGVSQEIESQTVSLQLPLSHNCCGTLGQESQGALWATACSTLVTAWCAAAAHLTAAALCLRELRYNS